VVAVLGFVPVRRAGYDQADGAVGDGFHSAAVTADDLCGVGSVEPRMTTFPDDPRVSSVLLDADRLAPRLDGGKCGGASACERIEDRFALKAEEFDQPAWDLGRKHCRMIDVRHVGDVPDGLRVLTPFFLGELALLLLCPCWLGHSFS
jgi:hypothetical protein